MFDAVVYDVVAKTICAWRPSGRSWAKPNLHQKLEVWSQAYTQFCSAAKRLQSNQIATLQPTCRRSFPRTVLANAYSYNSRGLAL